VGRFALDLCDGSESDDRPARPIRQALTPLIFALVFAWIFVPHKHHLRADLEHHAFRHLAAFVQVRLEFLHRV